MTPKEKAKKLVDKFEKILYPNEFATDEKYVKCVECALICVDEIIKSFEFCGLQEDEWDIDFPFTIKEYWQEVKQEIEKL